MTGLQATTVLVVRALEGLREVAGGRSDEYVTALAVLHRWLSNELARVEAARARWGEWEAA